MKAKQKYTKTTKNAAVGIESAPTDNERSEAAVDVPRFVRVILDNPNGYNNYQGTIKRVFMLGKQEWADVEWDMPVHPCTTPMETKHLIPANRKSAGPDASGKTP